LYTADGEKALDENGNVRTRKLGLYTALNSSFGEEDDWKGGIELLEVDEIREDIKIVAESVAVSVNNDTASKIAVIDNVAKLGAKKEVLATSKAKVEEEIAKEEAKKEETKQVIEKLENNKIETL
jgi:hypothetical protein